MTVFSLSVMPLCLLLLVPEPIFCISQSMWDPRLLCPRFRLLGLFGIVLKKSFLYCFILQKAPCLYLLPSVCTPPTYISFPQEAPPSFLSHFEGHSVISASTNALPVLLYFPSLRCLSLSFLHFLSHLPLLPSPLSPHLCYFIFLVLCVSFSLPLSFS